MADNVNVSGPIDVRSDCRERVAFDLMNRIAGKEQDEKTSTREYWIKLYHQCYLAVNGHKPDDVMKR